MICPYCDSRIEVLPDNRSCPHCGAPLGAAIQERTEYSKPPLGVYKQSFGFMEVQEQGVRFYEKFLWNVVDRFVPYQEIFEVRFVPGGKQLGYLCVRQRQDKNLPQPSTSLDAAGDKTSVIFGKSENEKYHAVYKFLKQCAEIANTARELQGESRL